MTYTKKNLRDVKDSAVEFGVSEFQEARFANEELKLEEAGLALMVVHPGQRQAFGHRHEAAEEIYVVVSGAGRVNLDGEIVEIGPLDAVRVEPQVTRQFEAGDEGLTFLALGPRREGDGEIVRDFWT